jgi:hypothetical protein
MLYEIEFGVVIGKKGFKISKSEANDFIGGYCVTLDMTSKDHWLDAHKNGTPWTISKAFDTSRLGNFKTFLPNDDSKFYFVQHLLTVWWELKQTTCSIKKLLTIR